jgi:hypothetical protein
MASLRFYDIKPHLSPGDDPESASQNSENCGDIEIEEKN